MEKPKIVFRPKSAHQKSDCINNSATHRCERASTLEAVVEARGRDSRPWIITIRCCDAPACKERAAELALTSYRDFLDE